MAEDNLPDNLIEVEPGQPEDTSISEVHSVSGNSDQLIGEKKKVTAFISAIDALDVMVSTPTINVSVIESAFDKAFKLFDAINNSKYVSLFDGVFVVFGLISIFIGVYVQQYRKLREVERNSDFFYFNRLLKLMGKEKIEEKMGKEPRFSYAILKAAAYFYPPDVSEFACKRRRIFCRGEMRAALNELNLFLQEGESRKERLNEIHQEIIKITCDYLNEHPLNTGKDVNKFQVCKEGNSWSIGLTDSYSGYFFTKAPNLIEKDKQDTEKANKDKKNRDFVFPILGALGRASFMYWILMFIFYFIPAAPVVTAAAISVIPLGIALLGIFPTLLIYNLHKAYYTNQSGQQTDAATIEEEDKAVWVKKIVELNKKQMFIAAMQENQASVCLKDSPVMKDLHVLLKKRRFIQCQAIVMGFIDGCFLPFFGGWLFLDGIKVAITYATCSTAAMASFTPIGLVATAVIAAVTLSLGLFYGICSARKANQEHKKRFDFLDDKIARLKKEAPNLKVLNLELCAYDRLFRRLDASQPMWTKIKKGLNRLLVIVRRLGTGSLVFRLVIWGPILALALVPAATGIPAGFATVLVAGTVIVALIAALSYLSAYNLEDRVCQADRVTEYFTEFFGLNWLGKICFDFEELAKYSLFTRRCNSNTEKPNVTSQISDPIKDSPVVEKENELSVSIEAKVADTHMIEAEAQCKANPNSKTNTALFKFAKKVDEDDCGDRKVNEDFIQRRSVMV